MKKVICSLLFLIFIPAFVFGANPVDEKSVTEELDAPTKEICNQVILKIFDEILKEKDRFAELKAFDRSALFISIKGIYAIYYKYSDPRLKAEDTYELLISIMGIDEEPFEQPGFEEKHDGFPLIELRTSRFIKRTRRLHFFNIDKIVEQANQILYEYQQQFHPLKIILEPKKMVFAVDEPIDFDIVVKNKGSQNLKTKKLGKDSLFVTINGKTWGTPPELNNNSQSEESILGPHETQRLNIKMEGFSKLQEVTLSCFYNVVHKNVPSFAQMKFKVE